MDSKKNNPTSPLTLSQEFSMQIIVIGERWVDLSGCFFITVLISWKGHDQSGVQVPPDSAWWFPG